MGHPAVAQITLAVTGATLNADAAPEQEQEGEMPAVPRQAWEGCEQREACTSGGAQKLSDGHKYLNATLFLN